MITNITKIILHNFNDINEYHQVYLHDLKSYGPSVKKTDRYFPKFDNSFKYLQGITNNNRMIFLSTK